MPFDGFVTKCISEELNILLTGGRIEKIQQPERDEIHLVIRNNGMNHRLLLSSNAAAPRVHLTARAKENPEKAPMFCMLMRKHIGGGRLLGVTARNYERVVEIAVESANELGDISTKTLIAEIMGKHSNIILVNENNRIVDSLVHVDQDMSSVREVMPARQYTPPPPQDKLIPGVSSVDEIFSRIYAWVGEQPTKTIASALLDSVMGASPLFCNELCRGAGADPQTPLAVAGAGALGAMTRELGMVLDNSFNAKYAPCIALREPPPLSGGAAAMNNIGDGRGYADFYCWEIKSAGAGVRFYATMCEAVDEFYDGRSRAAALSQRKADLVRLTTGNITRCRKKIAIHEENLREAANRDLYKLCGELITANIYNIAPGADTVKLLNYYSEKEGGEYLDVKLDGDLTPQANAQIYFRKYRKAVSTWKNAEIQAGEAAGELQYLESVLQELETSQDSREIDEIRQELASQKYVAGRKGDPDRRGNPDRRGGAKGGKQRSGGARTRKDAAPSEPHSFISSDGLTIFVGKNNGQNDRLTLKTAAANDMWLHARGIPGSHVIIKKQQGEIPESTLLEAASLAAYHSRARMGGNADVDYTQARHVRKPSGARPGMVIYDHQRTLSVSPDAWRHLST